jgi:hypothetical protein
MSVALLLNDGAALASIAGGVTGVLSVIVTIFDYRRAGRSIWGTPGLGPGGRWWLRPVIVLGACALAVAVVSGLHLFPPGVSVLLALIALAGGAASAVIVGYQARRRERLPVPTGLRMLLTAQWEEAHRHQYDYFGGSAPPLPDIYVEQLADVLPFRRIDSALQADAKAMSLGQMLTRFRSAVVIADPGVGKSTAMAQVLREQSSWWLNARRGDSPENTAPYGDLLPLAVPAAALIAQSLPEAMAEEFSRRTGAAVPREAFDEPPPCCRSWLVLVDGIDQVLSTPDRVAVLSRLGGWIAADRPAHCFMITTRPLGFGEMGNLGAVTRFELRRFNQAGLAAFAERWAVHRVRTGTSESAGWLSAETFLARVSTARLSAVARVPLIATIAALVLEASDGKELPASRAQLYDSYIKHLLYSRRMTADQRDRLAAEFSRWGETGHTAWAWLDTVVMDLLEGVAAGSLSAHAPPVTETAFTWVGEHAPPGLFGTIPGWQDAVRDLLTSTGLLVAKSGDLAFTHQSFAEYLAAGPLARDFDQPTWLADLRSPDSRNLALFVLARSVPAAPGTRPADPLIRLLLDRGGEDACIAGEILADGIPADPDLAARTVRELIAQLIMEESGHALRVLADLAADPKILSTLVGIAEDPDHPAWLRAFTADALGEISAEGIRLLHEVFATCRRPEDRTVLRWIARRLERADQATDPELAHLQADGADDIADTDTGAMAANGYRQIADDPGTAPGYRLRAVLALAGLGGQAWWTSLGDILTATGLSPQQRLEGARAVVQTGQPESFQALQQIAESHTLDLALRAPVLTALLDHADTQDNARQVLDQLAASEGEDFARAFPDAVASGGHTGRRSADQAPATQHAPAVFGDVPARNRNFTGRDDELTEMRRLFGHEHDQAGARVPVALQGLGACGKTQMAIEYAYRYRADYDVIWWVSARDPALIRPSLARLAPRLGLSPGPETAETVLEALQRGEPYRRWLLVFDSADQPAELTSFLPRGPGDVLITSRNHRWKDLANTVSIDVFRRSEAVEFLRRSLPRVINNSDADLLADSVGDLPLSLAHAASSIAATGISAADYTILLRKGVTELRGKGDLPRYPTSFISTHRSSVAEAEAMLPAATELLRCCSFFGADPIPQEIFRRTKRRAVRPLMQDIIADPVLLTRALRILRRLSLVTVGARTIQVQKLTAAAVREDMPQPDQEQFGHEVHLLLAGYAPAEPDDEAGRQRYEELLAHIHAANTNQCQDEDVRSFALNMMRYFNDTHAYDTAREITEYFLDRWIKDSGPQNPNVITARHHQKEALRHIRRQQGTSRQSTDPI